MKSKLAKKVKLGVIGGEGFLGSHFLEFVRKNGDFDVVLFSFPKDDLRKKDMIIKFLNKDLDIVVVFAGVNRGSDIEIVEGNFYIMYNLVSALKSVSKKIPLYYVSSIQAENNLDSVFGASKRGAELILREFNKFFRLPVGIFRPCNIFGEGGRPFYNSVVSTFCHLAASGKKLLINNPASKVNLIYVEDAVRTIFREIGKKREKDFFFIKSIKSKNVVTVGVLAKLIQCFSLGEDGSNLQKINHLGKRFVSSLKHTFDSYKNTIG